MATGTILAVFINGEEVQGVTGVNINTEYDTKFQRFGGGGAIVKNREIEITTTYGYITVTNPGAVESDGGRVSIDAPPENISHEYQSRQGSITVGNEIIPPFGIMTPSDWNAAVTERSVALAPSAKPAEPKPSPAEQPTGRRKITFAKDV